MKEINTKEYQLFSLQRYMFELGYAYDGIGFTRTAIPLASDGEIIGKFYLDNFTPKYLSFNDAVSMYNGLWFTHGQRSKSGNKKLSVNRAMLERAFRAKLVAQVKIQRKKGGEIICQNHLVNFMNGVCL